MNEVEEVRQPSDENNHTGERDRALTPTQLKLLNALYTETTMADVAKAVGYSPRHTRRLVIDLLHTIGVATTRQAVAHAIAEGLIKPPNPAKFDRRRDPRSPPESTSCRER